MSKEYWKRLNITDGGKSMLLFIRYIKGYVKLSVKSDAMERFFNMCGKKGIYLWNIACLEQEYEFCMSISDFRKIKSIVHKTSSRVKIKERYGLPFFLFRYQKKKMFFAGILFSYCLVYFLSIFIWDIQVEGSYTYTEQEILKCLKKKKIVHGIQKSKLNCEEIEKYIRNEYFDITWVSAEISGTRLIIHIKENFDNFIVEKEKDPYDLVANKSGVISSIITRSGTPMVYEGAKIKKGDTLVSGTIVILDDNKEEMKKEYVNADADIYAKTSYKFHEEISLAYTKREYTGKTKKSYYLGALEHFFYLGRNRVKYENYDSITENKQMKLARNFYLPIRYGTTTYREYSNQTYIYTNEEAKMLIQKKLDLFLEKLEKKGIQIIEKNVTIKINGKKCIGTGKIQVIEKIGKPVTISIEEGN